jgi:hypothetical protein
VLSRVLGDDYVRHAAMATFLAKHQDGIPNDLAALAGARLVIANESENGRRLDEATVKHLTGGDLPTHRRRHRLRFTSWQAGVPASLVSRVRWRCGLEFVATSWRPGSGPPWRSLPPTGTKRGC